MLRDHWLTLLRNRFADRSRSRARSRHMPHACCIEALEDRTLLTSFVVDSLLDTPDANPGDGVAEDAAGLTTLRAALMEAEALGGADVITFDIGAGGTIERGSSYPTITEDLTIIGPGADLLIMDANGSGRGFLIFNPNGSTPNVPVVEISGMTITGGIADPLGGSGVRNSGGRLTLRGVRITGNGSIAAGLTPGGGVVFGAGTIPPFESPGTLAIIDSLIDNNIGSRGGGVSIENGAGTASIINSTISNNATGSDGGGVYYYNNDNTLVIRNSTITNNRVTADASGVQIGGGLYVDFPSAPDPLPVLYNTIVAGNTAGTMTVVPDDINAGQVGVALVDAASAFNLIGDADTAGGLTDGMLGNIVGVSGVGTIPIATILETLSDNGGPTLTHKLAIGSPAIDAGSSPEAVNAMGGRLATDQRGPGFGRVINGDGVGGATVDIGAFEAPPGSGGGPLRYDDVIGRASSGTIVLARSTGTGFVNSVFGSINPAADWDDLIYGDFNGDGLIDAAGHSPSDGGWRVLINNGVSGFDPPAMWGTFAPLATYLNRLVGDFNGDGLDDVAAQATNGTWTLGLSTGSSFTVSSFGIWSPNVMWQDVQTGDFNGDGRTDVIGRSGSGKWVVGLSNGTSLSFSVFGAWSTIVSWQNVAAVDLNADGLTDIVGRASSGSWVAGLSDGTSFTMANWGGWSTNVTWDQVSYGDFNGDGSIDVVGRASSGTIVVGTSTGSSFSMSVFGSLSTLVTWPQIVTGDFNGDGRDDLAMRASTGTWVTGISTGTLFNFSAWGAWSPNVMWDDVAGGEFLTV